MPPDLTDAALSDYIAASAHVLGLSIEADWLPHVKTALLATQRASDFVAAFELPDDAEPAPVFKA